MIVSPLLSRINAALIGDGSVDNTEFGFLDGLTDFIQDQLNARPQKASGAGTTNALVRWDASDNLVDSGLSDDGTNLTAATRPLIFSGAASNPGNVGFVGRIASDTWINCTSGNFVYFGTGGTAVARLAIGGLMVGSLSGTPQAYLHARGTGTQLRLAYSDTVYWDITSSSNYRINFAYAGNARLTMSHLGSMTLTNGLDSLITTPTATGTNLAVTTNDTNWKGRFSLTCNGLTRFTANADGICLNTVTTPVAQSTGWSVAAHSALKSFDPATATLEEIGRVLGTAINYWLLRGDFGA